MICGPECELVVLIAGVEVEKGMTCAGELHELAGISFFLIGLGELDRLGIGYHSVCRAVKDKAGREIFLGEIIERARCLGDLGRWEEFCRDTIAAWASVRDGAEENGGIGLGRDHAVHRLVSRCAECCVSSSSSSAEHDLAGIDAQLMRMFFDKKNQLLGVFHCFQRTAVEFRLRAILRRDRHHSAAREVMPVRHELIRGRDVPFSSVEKNNRGTAISLVVEGRRENKMRVQLSLRYLAIHIACASLQDFTIARLPDE